MHVVGRERAGGGRSMIEASNSHDSDFYAYGNTEAEIYSAIVPATTVSGHPAPFTPLVSSRDVKLIINVLLDVQHDAGGVHL